METSNSTKHIDQVNTEGKKIKKKKLNLYNLPPKSFEGKDNVITFTDLAKTYNLEGRDEKVVALKNVTLAPG